LDPSFVDLIFLLLSPLPVLSCAYSPVESQSVVLLVVDLPLPFHPLSFPCFPSRPINDLPASLSSNPTFSFSPLKPPVLNVSSSSSFPPHISFRAPRVRTSGFLRGVFFFFYSQLLWGSLTNLCSLQFRWDPEFSLELPFPFLHYFFPPPPSKSFLSLSGWFYPQYGSVPRARVQRMTSLFSPRVFPPPSSHAIFSFKVVWFLPPLFSWRNASGVAALFASSHNFHPTFFIFLEATPSKS